MTTISGIAVNYVFNYFSPIIAEFLSQTYGTTSETVGFYVCVLPAVYTVASVFFGKIKTYKTIVLITKTALVDTGWFDSDGRRRILHRSYKGSYWSWS